MLRLKKIININRYNRVLSTYPESWSKLAIKELGGTKVYIIFIIIVNVTNAINIINRLRMLNGKHLRVLR